MNIQVRAKERLNANIKKFQKILLKAKEADVNESDTVTIISDMLSEIFGYDKYAEITSEYLIQKTFCDLAIVVNKKPCMLIECKAIGLNLKDDYVRQAINYSANSGIDWVVLTNGLEWKIFKVSFGKPIKKELVYEFNFLDFSAKKQHDLEMLYHLCKESFCGKSISTLEELVVQKQVLNKFVLGQLLISDEVLNSVRRQIRRMPGDVKTDVDELRKIVCNDILKREITEGEECLEAIKKTKKVVSK